MDKPNIYTNSLNKYYSNCRVWQGIPSVEITEKGKLYVAFYSGGDDEQLGNFCLLIESADGGKSFGEPIAAVDAGNCSRCFDPCLWMDGDNRLWFFWAMMPQMQTWAAICENPDGDSPEWSLPFYVCEGITLNKPIVTRGGKVLIPASVWEGGVCESMLKVCDKIKIESPKIERGAYAVTPDLKGAFEMLGCAKSLLPSFDEHMFIERKDGSLASYIRCKGNIEMSLSKDGGASWQQPFDSGIANPNSRFFIRRLRSGRILMINHVGFKGRNNLTAQLSEDDGATWKGGLLLDERGYVSYPDAAESNNEYIYTVYDRERGSKNQKQQNPARELLMAKFTEADVLAGKIISEKGELKVVISKLEENR